MDRKRQHCRAVTSLALLERARAWEWVKDPPAGEGQVGQKHLFGKGGTGWIEKPDGVDRKTPLFSNQKSEAS